MLQIVRTTKAGSKVPTDWEVGTKLQDYHGVTLVTEVIASEHELLFIANHILNWKKSLIVMASDAGTTITFHGNEAKQIAQFLQEYRPPQLSLAP